MSYDFGIYPVVIPSEARNPQFLADAECRSLALLGMTNLREK